MRHSVQACWWAFICSARHLISDATGNVCKNGHFHRNDPSGRSFAAGHSFLLKGTNSVTNCKGQNYTVTVCGFSCLEMHFLKDGLKKKQLSLWPIFFNVANKANLHSFLTCVFVGSAGKMLSWGRNEAVSLFGLPPSFLDVLVPTKTPHLSRVLWGMWTHLKRSPDIKSTIKAS